MNEKGNLKRKNPGIPLEKKVKIIKDFTSGKTVTELAETYGIHHSTVSRIIKKKEKIVQQYETVENVGGSEKRMRYTGIEETPFEKTLFQWFRQKRSLGEPVSGGLLRKKALDFHQKIHGQAPFTASDGWLTGFKLRHHITCRTTKGEKLSADQDESSVFKEGLNMFLKAQNYDLDNVYNADETGLQYKTLPERTLTAHDEVEVSGRKILKQRVTVLVCANATGTHKIPLLVIGAAKKPRCFKNVNNLPVEYRAQKSAWMDRTIFLDWYKNIFVPAIKERKPGSNERFILLLDNAPSHPPVADLDAVDASCCVFYLPPNVTSLIQPMDQGVISSIKRRYRELFLQELLNEDITEESGVSKFISKWSVLNCCDALFVAWNNVSSATLRNAWKNLVDISNLGTETVESNRVVELLNEMPGGVNYSEKDGTAWVHSDDNAPSCHILSDNEILNAFGGLNLPVCDQISEEINHEEESDRVIAIPSTSQVIDAFSTIANWCKTCEKDVATVADHGNVLRLRQRLIELKLKNRSVEE